MINLSLVNNCSSVKKNMNLSGKHAFYTDSRLYKIPGVFVAIPGAKVNPLDIIEKLLEEKCPLVFYQDLPENNQKVSALSQKYPATQFVPVSDSVTFLQELTHEHMKEWLGADSKRRVFAISGSNGKTTHKEMLSFILKDVLPGKVVNTEKNNNNHLGVPLTLLNVTDETEVVILELGSNHPGEIKVLCDIAIPNSGLTTNIGATHLEFFGTEKEVFEEEAYLYHAVKKNTSGQGFYLINKDDAFLNTLEKFPGAITYGENPGVLAQVSFLSDGGVIKYQSEVFEARNPAITGKHNKLNLVTCLFIASRLFPSHKEDFARACKKFLPTKNRSEWIERNGQKIFLDAYNANPSSMKAALHGFKESVLEQGKSLDETCIVLGDMNELGESTPQYHEDVGRYVKELGFKHVFFVGRFASHYQKGFPEGMVRGSSAEFKKEYCEDCLKKHSLHFIKGSRSLQLESLFDIT